ncbi:hypothetical protein BDF14DRAFT_1740376 [Spinellus fusiger]|nr:hypothetical protein BDF14DRAFT_1740376 [Spinellus fusiger]
MKASLSRKNALNDSTSQSARTRVSKPTTFKKTFRVSIRPPTPSPSPPPTPHPTSQHPKGPYHDDYLLMVAQEGHHVAMAESIEITMTDPDLSDRMNEQQVLGHQGAIWMEALVHAPSDMECQLKPPHLPPPSPDQRAKDTSLPIGQQQPPSSLQPPPPSLQPPLQPPLQQQDEHKKTTEEQRMKNKRQKYPTRKAIEWSEEVAKKKKKELDNLVQCICNTPHEEFGSMVQCDDCSSWLHVECLALSATALEETFQCPSCYMSLGTSKTAKLLSTVTWRYVAQWKSRRLAATLSTDSGSEDEEEEVHPPLLSCSVLSTPPCPPCPPCLNTPPPTPTVLCGLQEAVLPPGNTGARADSEADTETRADIPELSYAVPDFGFSPAIPSSPTHSEDTESASEASTPDQAVYGTDPFDLVDGHGEAVIKGSALGLFYQLSYLQSAHGKEDLLVPHANDVFLCENHHNSMYAHGPTTVNFAPDLPPSYICSQYLSEMSTVEEAA